jgi:enoyl-CoA hydratase
MAMALAADTRICSTTARFNAAFVRLGISGCDVGVSYLLPRIVGPTLAFEMMLTGRLIDADEALRSGMVLRVVPDDELMPAALEIATAIAANSRIGIEMTKQVMWSNLDAPDLRSAIVTEDRTQVLCLTTPEARAAIPAMLASRRSS